MTELKDFYQWPWVWPWLKTLSFRAKALNVVLDANARPQSTVGLVFRIKKSLNAKSSKTQIRFIFFFRTMILIPNSFFTRRGTHWAVVGAYQQGNSNFLKRFILYVTGVFWCGGIGILLFYVSSFFGCVITQKLICVVEKKGKAVLLSI